MPRIKQRIVPFAPSRSRRLLAMRPAPARPAAACAAPTRCDCSSAGRRQLVRDPQPRLATPAHPSTGTPLPPAPRRVPQIPPSAAIAHRHEVLAQLQQLGRLLLPQVPGLQGVTDPGESSTSLLGPSRPAATPAASAPAAGTTRRGQPTRVRAQRHQPLLGFLGGRMQLSRHRRPPPASGETDAARGCVVDRPDQREPDGQAEPDDADPATTVEALRELLARKPRQQPEASALIPKKSPRRRPARPASRDLGRHGLLPTVSPRTTFCQNDSSNTPGTTDATTAAAATVPLDDENCRASPHNTNDNGVQPAPLIRKPTMKSFHTRNSSTATATSAGRYVRCTVASTGSAAPAPEAPPQPVRVVPTQRPTAAAVLRTAAQQPHGSRPARSATRQPGCTDRIPQGAAYICTGVTASTTKAEVTTRPSQCGNPPQATKYAVGTAITSRTVVATAAISTVDSNARSSPAFAAAAKESNPSPCRTTNHAARPHEASATQSPQDNGRQDPEQSHCEPDSPTDPPNPATGLARATAAVERTTLAGTAHRRRRSPRTPITATIATIANSTTPKAAVRPSGSPASVARHQLSPSTSASAASARAPRSARGRTPGPRRPPRSASPHP